jgi:hypothetical protein
MPLYSSDASVMNAGQYPISGSVAGAYSLGSRSRIPPSVSFPEVAGIPRVFDGSSAENFFGGAVRQIFEHGDVSLIGEKTVAIEAAVASPDSRFMGTVDQQWEKGNFMFCVECDGDGTVDTKRPMPSLHTGSKPVTLVNAAQLNFILRVAHENRVKVRFPPDEPIFFLLTNATRTRSLPGLHAHRSQVWDPNPLRRHKRKRPRKSTYETSKNAKQSGTTPNTSRRT